MADSSRRPRISIIAPPLKLLQLVARQRWLRRGLRERVLRRFCPPETAPDIPFQVPFFGRVYRGRLGSYLDWNVFFYGAFEREILMLIRDVLRSRPGATFVDVGANVGQHTLFASGFAAQVHAFEPFEPVRASLVEKIEVNGIGNVVVHAVGLGDRSSIVPFFPPQGPNQGTGSFVGAPAANGSVAIGLPIVAGDDIALGLERLDLVKIDVEGYERAVLTGLREALERHRPVVLFEYSDRTRHDVPSVAALRALFPGDYDLYEIDTRRVVLYLFEIPRYSLKPVGAIIGSQELLAVPAERPVPMMPSSAATWESTS